MSSNVHEKKEMRDLIVLPSSSEKVIEQVEEQDWDAIAGVTGTPEGYPDRIIELKPKHYRALAMLLQGSSQIEVANELGVSKRTVNRWMTSGSILYEIYLKRRWILLQAANAKILNLYTKGVDKLFELLESSDERIQLDTVKLIVSKLKPNSIFNPDDLPEKFIEGYDKARNTSHSYFAHPGSTVFRKNKYCEFDTPEGWPSPLTKYALDPEDYEYKRELKYPEDEWWDEDYKEFVKWSERTHAQLSAEQIEEIVAELHAKNVETDPFDEGVVIWGITGDPVGLLFPPECDRPSLFQISYAFRQQRFKEFSTFFHDDRPCHPDDGSVRRGYYYIPEVDDIREVSKFLIVLAKTPKLILDSGQSSVSSSDE